MKEKLIPDEDWRSRFRKRFAAHDRMFGEELGIAKYAAHVRAILVNDWEGVTLENFANQPGHINVLRRRGLKADMKVTP